MIKTGALSLIAAMTLASHALAADHEIKMLNKGADGSMVFEPAVVNAALGDTVTFIPADKGHLSASVKGGIPEKAEPWAGKINERLTVTLHESGVYMYQCTPHAGMGMIGAVIVGEPSNLESVKQIKYPGVAKKRAEAIFAEIEAAK